MTREHHEALARLGVTRWDTFPPQAGRIRFFDRSDQVVAHGCYRVILSYGPGEQYTMGWAIEAYRSIGIPYVPREIAGSRRVCQAPLATWRSSAVAK